MIRTAGSIDGVTASIMIVDECDGVRNRFAKVFDMRGFLSFRQIVRGILLCWALIATPLWAADPPPESDPADDAHFQYLLKRQQAMTVKVDGHEAVLQTKPLFRWQNPVSGANGAVFVWSWQDRPVVLAKTHLNDLKQHYVESMSAATSRPFEVRRDGALYWSPDDREISPQAVTNVEIPAEIASIRLTQMRAIARRYRLTSFWGEENRSEWELRLLSTPLLRYASPEAGVIDGALFGFAQGTNPEAVLVVEATESATGKNWVAYPVRLSGYAIKAWRDEQLILDVPKLQSTTRNLSYFNFYERPQPYPFPAAKGSP